MEVVMRRGRRADPQKDEAILEAATALFLERGYAASIDDIAAAAGVSKQTIYARYACKHDLLAAIVHRTAEDLVSMLGDDAAKGSAEETLVKFAERFVDIVFDARRVAMQRLVIALSAQFPDLARLYHQSGPLFVQDRLAAFLTREAAAGRLLIDDAREATSQLLGLILGVDHMASLMGLLDPESEKQRRARVRGAVQSFVRLYAAR
jgi:AcrR family transcriptional regulator